MPTTAMPFSLTLPAPPAGAGGGQTRSRERSDPPLSLSGPRAPPMSHWGRSGPDGGHDARRTRAGRPGPSTADLAAGMTPLAAAGRLLERAGTGMDGRGDPREPLRHQPMKSARVSGSCPRPNDDVRRSPAQGRLEAFQRRATSARKRGQKKCSSPGMGIGRSDLGDDRPRAGRRPGGRRRRPGHCFQCRPSWGSPGGSPARRPPRRAAVAEMPGLGRGHDARGTAARCPVGGAGAGAPRRPARVPAVSSAWPIGSRAGRRALAGWDRSVGPAASVGSDRSGGAERPGRGGRPDPKGMASEATRTGPAAESPGGRRWRRAGSGFVAGDVAGARTECSAAVEPGNQSTQRDGGRDPENDHAERSQTARPTAPRPREATIIVENFQVGRFASRREFAILIGRQHLRLAALDRKNLTPGCQADLTGIIGDASLEAGDDAGCPSLADRVSDLFSAVSKSLSRLRRFPLRLSCLALRIELTGIKQCKNPSPTDLNGLPTVRTLP